ncbi:hypothetical protein [Kutzneria chonburiensis]|uniref:Uncharacterized protein n=1 Tax=Kutzneria chonburiensis TaxID=1483604 RepID=A0ABV6N3B0_9PSEU|nr:hypothetical protein [Kutzneria chonburiensis]
MSSAPALPVTRNTNPTSERATAMPTPREWDSPEYPAYIQELEGRQAENMRNHHNELVQRLAAEGGDGLVPISILVWEPGDAYGEFGDGAPVCDSRTSLPPEAIAKIMDVYYAQCEELAEKHPHRKLGGLST